MLAFHEITGSETTSYFFRSGKVTMQPCKCLQGHTCKHLHGYVVASKTFKILIQKNLGGN